MNLIRIFIICLPLFALVGCIESSIYPGNSSGLTFDNCDLSEFNDTVTVKQELKASEDNQKDALRYFSVIPNGEVKSILIYLHGNGTTACQFITVPFLQDLIQRLAAEGIAVFVPEYAGYVDDETTDVIFQKRILNNISAVYAEVLKQFPSLPMHLWGRSLGSGIATYLAGEVAADELSTLTLTSPYTSAVDILSQQKAFQGMPIPWLKFLTASNSYPAATWAKSVAVPTLVFVGGEDTLILPEISKQQAHYFTSSEVKFIEVADADHVSIMYSELQRDKLIEFISLH